MNKEKLSVGQKVFLKPVGNAARDGYKEIKENVILKIGRKYFLVGIEEKIISERFLTKFSIEDLREVSDYSANWKLYFSKQEILDEEESNKLIGEIKSKFDTWGKVNLSLDQLRRIKDIIIE